MLDKYQLWHPPLEYQGNVGNCVAQSIAVIYEVYEHYYRPNLGHRDFSVGYTYGIENWNVGMDEVQALKATIAHGNVPRADFESLLENPACYHAVQRARPLLAPIKYFKDFVPLGKVDTISTFIARYNLPVLLAVKNKAHAVACIGWERVVTQSGISYENGKPVPFEYYEDRLICVDSHNKISIFTKFDEAYGLIPISTEKEEGGEPMEIRTPEAAYTYLNTNGLTIFEQRFNDNITRGEVMILLARMLELMKK